VTDSRILRVDFAFMPWFVQSTPFCGGTNFDFSHSRYPTCGSRPQYNGHVEWVGAVAHRRGRRHRVPENASAAYWDGYDIVFEVAGCSGLIRNLCNG
jgi:hypothetical protein